MSLTAKQIQAIPSVSISDLEKSNNSAVWVFNMSGSSTTSSTGRGVINVSVNDGVGNKIPIRIPITWVPIDLTTQATKSALLTSPDFRKLASKGVLKLISDEEAIKIVSTPEGAKETMVVHTVEKYQGDLDNISADVSGEVTSDAINPTAVSVTSRDDLDEDSCIGMLNRNEMVFNNEDYKYIAKNSKFSSVKDWAIARIDG